MGCDTLRCERNTGLCDQVDPGITIISFTAKTAGQRMQVDLQAPLQVDSVTGSAAIFRDGAFLISEQAVPTTREGDVIWGICQRLWRPGISHRYVYYHGVPRVAKHPPWDGGLDRKTDGQGNPWMSVACQGLGRACGTRAKTTKAMNPIAPHCTSLCRTRCRRWATEDCAAADPTASTEQPGPVP
ncbi:MAG: hypothetical protein IPK99_09140 [Flavobacteriales bacterium]|nr:hypothetical protein [Flavobacteriales bacterium]